MTDDKTPMLVDTTVKSDEIKLTEPQKIDVIPEAKTSERPYSTRKNAAIVNEPENNSKKQSISESASDIKVSLMVICCPCPEPKCKESDKCDNCNCKESDKCDCDKCDCEDCKCEDCKCEDCKCENCECKKSNKCEKPDKPYCVDHFPFFINLCTCFGMGPKDIVQTHPFTSK
jgi:hypothetical protein